MLFIAPYGPFLTFLPSLLPTLKHISIICTLIINNELSLTMNFPAFMHSQKEYKDSTLPLPLAPVYSLPHHKWYFSSPSLTPLRKKRENCSLFRYLQQAEMLSEKQEGNGPVLSVNRELLCVYEKCRYFEDKLKHIFDLYYAHHSTAQQEREKLKCQCKDTPDDEGPKEFKVNADRLSRCLAASQKNSKNECLGSEQGKVNWYEFTVNLIYDATNVRSYSINEENLCVFKLPECKDGGLPILFNVLWSDSYVIFNNGNKVEINQNMKSKAVQLCEGVARKLEDWIWSKAKQLVGRVAEEISDHERFLEGLQRRLKVSTFKLWFYKKDTNNQIYALSLTHITFKGFECTLYRDLSFSPLSKNQPKQNDQIQLADITQLSKSYENKAKQAYYPSKSQKTLKKLINANQLSKMNIRGSQCQAEAQVRDGSIIQCACCRNVLSCGEVGNQITANHIEQIRYLRQIKIGKIDDQPYDFVKICAICYAAYLKHPRNPPIEKRAGRRQGSKNSHSFFDKPSSSFQDYKSREGSFKLKNHSSKRMLFGTEGKERAKSELNNSKEKPELENLLTIKDRSVSMKPPIFCPAKPKHKKVQTTKTTNSENTVVPREELSDLNGSQFLIGRTQTEDYSIQPHVAIARGFSNNTQSILQKVLACSYEQKKAEMEEQAAKAVHAKAIMNAIYEYQKVERPSFKKMICKNHRSYLLKEKGEARVEGRNLDN